MNFSHPYLVWSLVLLGFCVAGFLIFSRERKKIFVSAILSMPAACTAVLFVPAYWKPIRITPLSVGIEDLIFSFATGGIVWIFVSFTACRNFTCDIALTNVIKRYLILVALGMTLLLILYRSTNWGVMFEAMIGISVAGFILLLRQRFRSWRIAAAGSILFTLYYFFVTGLILYLFPHMDSYWNKEILLGISVLNVPLEEIVWAFGFGAVWPLAMTYVFDLDLSDYKGDAAHTLFHPS
jgi:hypothetical protein